ncbi:unnamed protein product [Clonostachys chloroleuca]|uniref:Uncharacterized protein n=1 Tax=Clonostachys chloroleuca TaxID=1926264 RepID=A0AA35LP13_9HYPO|nr:unnamed protein product [Clonostachys chloroleuca]
MTDPDDGKLIMNLLHFPLCVALQAITSFNTSSLIPYKHDGAETDPPKKKNSALGAATEFRASTPVTPVPLPTPLTILPKKKPVKVDNEDEMCYSDHGSGDELRLKGSEEAAEEEEDAEINDDASADPPSSP